METFHRLLKRQVEKFLPGRDLDDPAFKDFFRSIDQAYRDFDESREQIERTLELSSNELFKTNQQLEEKVHERTRELLEVQQFAGMGSFEIDFASKYSSFTEHSNYLLGLAAEETSFSEHLLKNLRRNVHPADLDALDEVWQKATVDREDVRTEFRVIHPDGRTAFLLWNVKTTFSEQGKILQAKGTLQDMTDRIETEQQIREYAQSLEKINKELDQFAYIVSHDLKAPLRAINNLSVWIEEDLEGKMEGDTQKNFGMLRGRIQRLESLINGILQYSRAGRIKAETHDIDLNPFLDDLISNLAPPEHFKFNIQENMPVLNTEKIAIDQVFSNYLSNSVKYNNNSTPVIEVTFEDLGTHYKFCVGDNGPGIDEEFHEKVFQIFQTLQARDVVESTGVGLAIVKKIIEEKGGKAWVESSLGNGARFFFTIPKN